jgi:hypothetical protein
MPNYQIFIVELIIRAVVKGSRQETHHVILVEIHVAHIALILVVIDKIGTTVAVGYLSHAYSPFSV